MVFVVFSVLVCLGAWRGIEDHASPLMVIMPELSSTTTLYEFDDLCEDEDE